MRDVILNYVLKMLYRKLNLNVALALYTGIPFLITNVTKLK
jgi:hypothetical protein